jgi:hypothetical protein
MAGRIRLSDKLTTLYTLPGKSLSIRKRACARVWELLEFRDAARHVRHREPIAAPGALLEHVLDLSAAEVPSPAYFASSLVLLEAGYEALAHAARF